MTVNYFNKKGELIASDCYFCGKKCLIGNHKTIIGPICYISHNKCPRVKNDKNT